MWIQIQQQSLDALPCYVDLMLYNIGINYPLYNEIRNFFKMSQVEYETSI